MVKPCNQQDVAYLYAEDRFTTSMAHHTVVLGQVQTLDSCTVSFFYLDFLIHVLYFVTFYVILPL